MVFYMKQNPNERNRWDTMVFVISCFMLHVMYPLSLCVEGLMFETQNDYRTEVKVHEAMKHEADRPAPTSSIGLNVQVLHTTRVIFGRVNLLCQP